MSVQQIQKIWLMVIISCTIIFVVSQVNGEVIKSKSLQPPDPNILEITYDNNIELGDYSEIYVRVRNDGGTSDEGGISISFPSFTGSNDDQYVYRINASPDINYYEYSQGDTIWHRNVYQFPADYLLVEGVDWNWMNNEINYLKISVEPKQTGTFVFYVRSAMGQGETFVNDPEDDQGDEIDQQGWEVYEKIIDVVGITEELPVSKEIPDYCLGPQCAPNPFSKETAIRYSLPQKSKVVLKIYDTRGREISTLVDETQKRGKYRVNWNIRDIPKEKLPNGVYFYHFKADDFSDTKKMVMVR